MLTTLVICITAAYAIHLKAASARGQDGRARLALISKAVFGPAAGVAECIAHYESTDGAHLSNWPNEGPWQDSVTAHPWIDARRIVTDWWYAARVTYRISNGGRDWSPWTTHALCGV